MNEQRKIQLKEIHYRRLFNFKTSEVPADRKYFGEKRPAILALIFTLLLIVVIYFFTDYKESIVKIGIFTFLFSVYKLYKVFAEPALKLDKEGIHFHSARFGWSKIKKINVDWDNKTVNFSMRLVNGKIAKEKLEDIPIMTYFNIFYDVRAFKKKYRNPYKFK